MNNLTASMIKENPPLNNVLKYFKGAGIPVFIPDEKEEQVVPVSNTTEAFKRAPMGSVDIPITRDFKTITAHVDIAYFRRPEPSTYWINGDRGDDGEVILGQAMTDFGLPLILSDEEKEQAIEAFKNQ